MILDNGMSFAMAPEETFTNMIKSFFKNNGIICFEMQPVWGCKCSEQQYNSLPPLKFNFHGMNSSSKKNVEMPKEAYMMHKKKGDAEMCFLLIGPWKFAGLGKKSDNDEYWILGAQFLQNYYSVYNFEEGKIGLIESVTSRIGTNSTAAVAS